MVKSIFGDGLKLNASLESSTLSPLSSEEFQANGCVSMGLMRFRVPNATEYDPQIWSTAFISGLEGIPWACRNRLVDDCLTIERTVNESGKLSIVWPTEDYGPIVLTTGSLRCVDQPYWLQLELARGSLHRVRGRGLDWQRVGLKLPNAYSELIEEAMDLFIQAATSTDSPESMCSLAQRSIDKSIGASRPLTRAFVSQSLQARHQQEKQFSALLGVRVTPEPIWKPGAELALPAMNTLNVSMELGDIEATRFDEAVSIIDEQIEWARNHGLRVFGGPFLNLQSHAIPKWFYLFNDFDSLYRTAVEHATKLVDRYRGRIHLWNTASGLNAPNPLGLNDEQVLQLAVGVIQAVRRSDPKTPVILSIDAPWAEYLSAKPDGISPLHFADALVRADLGLSGLGLELNLNFWPTGSLPRDLVDISDLVDHWNILGLPLLITVTTPCGIANDAMATAKCNVVSNWKYQRSESIGEPYSGSSVDEVSKDSARTSPMSANGLEVVRMLLAKNNVHGIIWNQLSDRAPHAFPNSGLIDAHGVQRSMLEGLVQLRRMHIH